MKRPTFDERSRVAWWRPWSRQARQPRVPLAPLLLLAMLVGCGLIAIGRGSALMVGRRPYYILGATAAIWIVNLIA